MKKFQFLYLLPICLLLGLSSCSTDFDLTAEYKEVPVIYGLLNQQEQVHYIRIHKGFLDEETSALVIAKDPDSIYYGESLIVTVEELNTGHIYTLERVNGDTLNPPRPGSTGTFAFTPNILYRFTANLDPSSDYRLKVENPLTGHIATATTGLVRDFEIRFPFTGQEVNFVNQFSDYRVRWDLAENSRIYDLYLKVYYSHAEDLGNNNISRFEQRSFDWQVFKNRDYAVSDPEFFIVNESFYTTVREKLEPLSNPDHVRVFDSLEFTLYAGTPVLSNYINYAETQTGITGTTISPVYTNIENGVGIFTARYYKTKTGVPLTDLSIDSLACGSTTGNLGFAPPRQLLKYPYWPNCQ